MIAPGSRYLLPISAGLAVVLSSTALCGVLDGFDWLWHLLASVTTVVLVGLLARNLRLPTLAVLPLQLAGLTMLLTALFGKDPALGVLPTGETIQHFGAQLSDAIDQIESGIPPVDTTPELSLLVTLGFGLVMLVVDPLVVAGHGPAVGGLVLLGGYTVPTALDPDALPVWTLVAGAAGYALHLMLAHRERLARRGILAEPRRPPAARTPLGRRWQRLRAAARAGTGTPIATALTAAALAVAVGLSSLATFIGTDGRFAGNGHGHAKKSGTEFGLNPFTTLHGELDKNKPVELMRVRGLPGPQYLRAVSLTRYVPSKGWELPDRRNSVDMNGALPSGLGRPVDNPTATIQIQNLGYKDRWLPLFGQPMSVTGLIPGRWKYDVISGTAYSDSALTEPSWTERAGLPEPSVAALQRSGPAEDVDPMYLNTDGITTRISDLAQAITKAANSPFEKIVAINRFFLDPANGFRYSLKTAPGASGDALEDFLFRSKVGYCEQFASAMAVMLRAVGVPARVAVGFTSGQPKDDYRSITTADAHAWVEGYLTGVGWLAFDPTPLGDGRTITPSYVAQAPPIPIKVPPSLLAAGQGPGTGGSGPNPPNGPPPPPAGTQPNDKGNAEAPRPDQQQHGAGNTPTSKDGQQQGQQQSDQQPGKDGSAGGSGTDPGNSGGSDRDSGSDGGSPDKQDKKGTSPGLAMLLSGIGLVVLLTLLGFMILAAIAAAPAALRSLARHNRMARAARGGAAGAEAAWREVLAEFVDRGADTSSNETVRGSARKLSRAHRLDRGSMHGMRTVVSAVERGWYAPSDAEPEPGPDLVAAVTTVRNGLSTSAPLSVGARIWPRSVIRGPRPRG